jgi:hypothetical protein
MKRAKFFTIIIGILLIGSGFAAGAFASDGKSGPSAAVREYGETDAILDADGKFTAVLRYPKTGIDAADKAIYEWASGVYDGIREEAISNGSPQKTAEAEINVNYSAFKVKGDYAGIEEIGDLSASFLAHPEDIVKTFNIDIKGQKLLTPEEILNHDVGRAVSLLRGKIAKAYPEMRGELDDVDGTWLEHLVLKPDGVDVLLPRGAYLPSDLGLQRFTLAYEEIGGFLKGR